jgi:hypothetical protein
MRHLENIFSFHQTPSIFSLFFVTPSITNIDVSVNWIYFLKLSKSMVIVVKFPLEKSTIHTQL